MNNPQIESLIRAILLVLGTVLTNMGWTTNDQWNTVVTLAMQIIGPTLMLAPIIWSMFAHSRQGTLRSAAKLPEVDKIVVTSPKLAEDTPSEKVVAANGSG